MTVRLVFDQGFLSTPHNARFTELSGHDAVVMPEYEGDGSCTVDVFNRPYRSRDDGPTERLRLVVIWEISFEGDSGNGGIILSPALLSGAYRTLHRSPERLT